MAARMAPAATASGAGTLTYIGPAAV